MAITPKVNNFFASLPLDGQMRSLHFCNFRDLISLYMTSNGFKKMIVEAAPDVAKNHTNYDRSRYANNDEQLEVMGMQYFFANVLSKSNPNIGAPQFHALKEFTLSDRAYENDNLDVLISEMVDNMGALPQLKTLHLMSSHIPRASLEQLSNRATALTHIHAHNSASMHFLNFCRGPLESLSITSIHAKTERGVVYPLETIGRNRPVQGQITHDLRFQITLLPQNQLKTLKLSWINNFTNEQAIAMGSHLRNLKVFEFSHCKPCTDEGVFALMENSLHSLRDVSLASAFQHENITASLLSRLGNKMEIEKLSLESSKSIDNVLVIYLLTSSKYMLQSLQLEALPQITGELLYELPAMHPKLSACDFERCPAITLLGLRYFFSHAHLTNVSLNMQPANDQLIATLIANQPHLTNLQITRTQGILTDHTLEILSRTPNLLQLYIDQGTITRVSQADFSEQAVQNIARVWRQKRGENIDLFISSLTIKNFYEKYANFRDGKGVRFVAGEEEHKE